MATLITGGMGQVGSWVAKELISQAEEVILLDKETNADILARPGCEFMKGKVVIEKGDILDVSSTFKIMNRYKSRLNGIIHTAGIGASGFNDQPYQNVSLNTIGTLNMLEICRELDIKKFIYASSGAVYGDLEGPIPEKTAYNTVDLYGASKASSELIAEHYAKAFHLDIRIARLYFVYGPGTLPAELKGLYRGLFGPLQGIDNLKFNRGKNTKVDFTHTSDVAQGITRLYNRHHVNHPVYNISGGRAFRVDEIVNAVNEVLGRNSNIVFGEGEWLSRGAPLDITLAKEELGFFPKFSNIKKGIIDYLSWIQTVSKK